MCHITATPHPCGHTSTHLLMPCNAPKLPAPGSHDDYCTNPKVQYLTAPQAVEFTCAVCHNSRRNSSFGGGGGPSTAAAPATERTEGMEHAKRDSASAIAVGKENVRDGGGRRG
ncbi:hypothetical protein MMC27_000767 [Xylographa pallens]|nr:hypothetical protein [Xylographa pallens]